MMPELIVLAILSMENSDDQAFIADLYARYNKLMLKTAYKFVQDSYCAEDIVQDAFINLIKKVSVLKPLNCCTLTSYIVFTIENTALNFIKRRDRNSESAFLFGDDEGVIAYIPEEETPEKIFLDKEEAERIRTAIDELKPKYRLALQCKYFHNMSDKQIAEILDVKPDSVREYLTRARKAAQKVLEKGYDFYGSK